MALNQYEKGSSYKNFEGFHRNILHKNIGMKFFKPQNMSSSWLNSFTSLKVYKVCLLYSKSLQLNTQQNHAYLCKSCLYFDNSYVRAFVSSSKKETVSLCKASKADWSCINQFTVRKFSFCSFIFPFTSLAKPL